MILVARSGHQEKKLVWSPGYIITYIEAKIFQTNDKIYYLVPEHDTPKKVVVKTQPLIFEIKAAAILPC